MKRELFVAVLLTLYCASVYSQAPILRNGNIDHFAAQDDSLQDEQQKIPEGIFCWNVDERFGERKIAKMDTVPHLFQNRNFTDGVRGHYNFLGNLGSPRYSRIYTEINYNDFYDDFIFTQPYSFFLRRNNQIAFTNTKSPFTELTYNECGNKRVGDDHIRALFATNINKQAGVGFTLDYAYGRGYFQSQAASQFNGTIYASYIGDHYKMHVILSSSHLKVSENGGVVNDTYITNPESFPTRYSSYDIPVQLSHTYNRLHLNSFFFSHNYSLGFTRFYDKNNHIVRIKKDRKTNSFLHKMIKIDSVANNKLLPKDSIKSDSILKKKDNSDSLHLRSVFIPVARFIHTLSVNSNYKLFNTRGNEQYYADAYLPENFKDKIDYMRVSNLFGIELREGFNKWVKSGLLLYAKDDFIKVRMPEALNRKYFDESHSMNYITLGGKLQKKEGKIFHYSVLGEIRTTGIKWGEFNIESTVDLNIPIIKDTLGLRLNGFSRSVNPAYFYEHYHSAHAWWDTNLGKQFITRVGGELQYKGSKLFMHLQNMHNYIYYQSILNKKNNTHAVSVEQYAGNIQTVEIGLYKKNHWGILNWENEIIYQKSTNKDIFPLPMFNLWSNLFLKFTIAKVLHTELGADLRFFTAYHARTYSPIVGMYALQDRNQTLSMGNIPLMNVYANFDLKRTRFYIMGSHVNTTFINSKLFYVPHYPLNSFVVRFGLSWNFSN